MRWLLGLTIIAAGLGWYFGPFGQPEPEANGASVVLQRPQPATALARPANAPVAPPAERQAAAADAGISGPMQQARALLDAGDRQGAEAELRKALASVKAPVVRGRTALELAALVADKGERRRLLGVALRSGAVRAADYDVVGAALRTLNLHPKASLLDILPSKTYEVRSGDSLWKICTKTLPETSGVNLEAGLLRMLNGMSSDSLRAGQVLMIPEASLEVIIDRDGHGLVAWLGDLPLIAYQVGLGKEGRTPSGTFVVEVKQTEPTWYTEGRAIPFGEDGNILGTRWMGFENRPGVMGYGIHGTARPDTIGSDESMGCVRMRNENVEELFELVPRGTHVQIP